ncbi:hypothetical protein GH714_020698 [Hevea brasiliensis]|uniref:Uncharacterized protein n=1 Tax=Hevea brasiliensis TaxID=3981 RepID=A0A6A6LAH1_HEVBR|nr:hypothetical protein GH714_020698 [Hevea brasiliensis]
MHDVLRELALSISEREIFCTVYDARLVTEASKARRFSILTANGDSESYRGMSQLRSLFVFVKHVCFPNTLLSKFKLLRVLDLEDARIEKLSDGLETLFNLRLEEDILHHIADLSHLGNLDLDNAFVGEELHFSGGFLKLRSLWLSNFLQLRLITIDKGTMPNIQLLCLASCKALNALPQGIESLAILQTLLLSSSSSRLVGSINDKESKDHSKVQHIPNIEIL